MSAAAVSVGRSATIAAALVIGTIAAGVLGALSQASESTAPSVVPDIPPDYLAAYTASATRFGLGDDGWSYIAAVGKIESDHGRSSAPGVRSGQNFHGCCAGPMQIHNGFGSGGGTWEEFKTDGDGDDRFDIYDPDDAVATAARYLRASGAPGDWKRALFAYNHSARYVAEVIAQAAAYRSAAATPPQQPGPVAGAGDWLAPVPGFPGERCDRRIVADVVLLTRGYGLNLTDCFGGPPHDSHGEHPLGLAADLVPVDGDWNRALALARAAGWSPACAASGCGGRGPFRVVLYNGFPGHGDPAHTDTPHLHVSWQHSPAPPFTRAGEVLVLTATGGAR